MSDPVANWRPIRQGECIREYTRLIDGPMRRESVVRYCLSLPSNADRGRFLGLIRDRHGQHLYDSIRKEVWRRL